MLTHQSKHRERANSIQSRTSHATSRVSKESQRKNAAAEDFPGSPRSRGRVECLVLFVALRRVKVLVPTGGEGGTRQSRRPPPGDKRGRGPNLSLCLHKFCLSSLPPHCPSLLPSFPHFLPKTFPSTKSHKPESFFCDFNCGRTLCHILHNS